VESYGEIEGKLWTVGRVICAVLAGVGFILTLWVYWQVLANPFFEGRFVLIIPSLFSSAIFINMGLAIPQFYLIEPGKLRLLAGLGKWLLTVVLPVFMAVVVSSAADRRSVKISRASLAPLIDSLDLSGQRSGAWPEDLDGIIETVKVLRAVTYYRGTDHYVLQTPGGSFDIDGSRNYYLSSERRWEQIQNVRIGGKGESARRYNKVVEGLTGIHYWVNDETFAWERRK